MLFSHEKKDIWLFLTTWMKFEGIILSEISRAIKDKYRMILLIRGHLKKLNLQKQREVWCLPEVGVGMGRTGKQVKVVKGYKLPVVR